MEKLIKRYLAGESLHSISKSEKIWYFTLWSKFKKLGIKLRNCKEAHSIGPQHRTRNSLAFHKINTEEKAYWLGFLYADGSVQGKYLSLGLSKKDLPHLLKFQTFLKSNHKIINDKYGYKLTISDQQITSDLKQIGCIERKTFKITFPIISTNLIRHFIRGYFDGDGCITYSKYPKENNKIRWRFEFIGNLQFLNQLQIILLKSIPSLNLVNLLREKRHENPIYYLRYGCSQDRLCNIYEYLYDNSTVYLDRKKNKFQEIFNQYGSIFNKS